MKMNKMFNPTAKKLGEGIEVTYYEKPCPSDNDYETRYCEGQSWGDFLYKEHIASVKTAMVYADHLPELKLITGWDDIYPTALIHGVRIDAVKDRLDIKSLCQEAEHNNVNDHILKNGTKQINKLTITQPCTCKRYNYIVLKPIQVTEKVITADEMHLNMQYYMEYCQRNGYVTPQHWIAKHKHF